MRTTPEALWASPEASRDAAWAAAGLPLTREAFGFRADNQLAQLAAVRAGIGIGACQYGVARRDPDLVPVLTEAFRFDLEIWVAMHEDLKSSLRMRLLFDALAAGLAAYVASSAVQP